MSLRPSARAEGRMKAYKLAVDATEARRKREDGMVEIRKSKRDESLQKKRREGSQHHQPLAPTGHSATTDRKVKWRIDWIVLEVGAWFCAAMCVRNVCVGRRRAGDRMRAFELLLFGLAMRELTSLLCVVPFAAT
jgi:hypothetical protein